MKPDDMGYVPGCSFGMERYVKFRGRDVLVKYRDYGYEPDTNAHEIDWEFVGETFDDLTDEEWESVYYQLTMMEE